MTTEELSTSELSNELLTIYGRYMRLKLYVEEEEDNDDKELKKLYISAADKHNHKVLNNSNVVDAGFDIYVPQTLTFDKQHGNKLDHNIICSAQMITYTERVYNSSYYMYPRSSISKTRFRLANSVGIIDAGYRGHLIGVVDITPSSYPVEVCYGEEEYMVKKHDRLLQICAPGLVPIVVEIVESKEELGLNTERGTGGFGSTGR